MLSWDAQQVARAAGAQLLSSPFAGASGPERVTIDSRDAGPGALFVGLPGERTHGGAFADQALQAGAWGVLTGPEYAGAATTSEPGVRMAAEDPLGALQRLATAWRRHLNAAVIGVTGSTGKTSTKDLLLAVLSTQRMTVASRSNFNTEIGLPLEILAAPGGTQCLVLEMGMRGPGQIAELAAIAEPDVGVIVSVGPVHLESLGTLSAIVAAKAELIAGLEPGATAVLPADEPLLAPYRREDLTTLTFGDGGDVRLAGADDEHVEIDLAGKRIELEVNFTQAHLRRNLLAAAAAAHAVGVTPRGRIELVLSPGRGQRQQLPGGVLLIDDCYNANSMSMRAALDDLDVTAKQRPGSRRVAVLGDMLELGPDAREFHAQIGEYATGRADVLVTVGPLAEAIASRYRGGEHHHAADSTEAAELVRAVMQPDDIVLVKASRGVALERVTSALTAGAPA